MNGVNYGKKSMCCYLVWRNKLWDNLQAYALVKKLNLMGYTATIKGDIKRMLIIFFILL